jgi:hypothetical protein
MRNVSIRFGSSLKRWFYGVFGVLFISGALWLVVHDLVKGSDDLEEPYGSLEQWWLRIHGAAAMISLVLLGSLIPTHMSRAWELRRNRATAVTLSILCIVLIASGYGLYYFGSEELRPFVSGFHSVAGGLFPIVLIWHIHSGRKRYKLGRSTKGAAYTPSIVLSLETDQIKKSGLQVGSVNETPHLNSLGRDIVECRTDHPEGPIVPSGES